MSRRWQAVIGSVIEGGRAALGADQPVLLKMMQDFERARPGVLTPYRQPPGSVLEVIAAPDTDVIEGKQSLRVRTAPTQVAGDRPEYQIGSIDVTYLPPEADAIRAKVRVKSGTFTLTWGGPTVYFGNSDVQLEPQAVTGDGKTYVVEWSLHHRSSRNFRRLNASLSYGREMAFIHYPRWIQEPIRLSMVAPPAGDPGGEMMIDSIELISRGEGRPFPVIAAADCVERGRIDFKDNIAATFTFTLAVGRDIRMPPKLSHLRGKDGLGALQVQAKFVEETSVAGIRVASPPLPPTNALAIDLAATHEKQLPMVVDVLLVLAGDGFSLPGPIQDFDHDFSNPALTGKDIAFYHARRPIDPAGSGILIPFADFACFFGQGTLRPAMTENAPIDPARIVAVGILVPYGLASGTSTLTIPHLRWLTVPGRPAELRSYRQPLKPVTLLRQSHGLYGGTVRQDEQAVPPPVAPTAQP